VGVATHLVATRCFLSSSQRKSEIKSKWCGYSRIASFWRSSHSLMRPSSSPVAKQCGMVRFMRFMGEL